MKMWLASFIIVVSSLAWTPEMAADVLDQPKDIREALDQGKKGAWLDMSALRRVLECEIGRGYDVEHLRLLEKEVLTLKIKANTLEGSLVLADRQIDALSKKGSTSDKYVKELEAEVDKWYRKPVVMAGIGLAIGFITGSITVVAVYAALK